MKARRETVGILKAGEKHVTGEHRFCAGEVEIRAFAHDAASAIASDKPCGLECRRPGIHRHAIIALQEPGYLRVPLDDYAQLRRANGEH